LTFDVSTIQEFYIKEIISMDFPQHSEVFYFYGQALLRYEYSADVTGGKPIAI
jgi:hypothetical protein